MTVAQFAFDTNVKEQLDKINRFDRLPAITEWSRTGTAAGGGGGGGGSSLLIKNNSEPSLYLPVLHRPTIAHDKVKSSDLSVKNSLPRPVSSHRHESENLVFRNVDLTHYNTQYENEHSRLMKSIKNGKTYHINRTLLPQLRRGGQQYCDYNNEELFTLKKEVQTEVIQIGFLYCVDTHIQFV